MLENIYRISADKVSQISVEYTFPDGAVDDVRPFSNPSLPSPCQRHCNSFEHNLPKSFIVCNGLLLLLQSIVLQVKKDHVSHFCLQDNNAHYSCCTNQVSVYLLCFGDCLRYCLVHL